ncbi:MAG: hypothetical protein QM786_13850 [Breznakibacter sp.]
MKRLIFALSLGLALVFAGCEKDDDKLVLDVTDKTGYYVLNEGSFGDGNASIGFLDSDGTYYDDLFFKTNNRVLGDVLQSICIDGHTAYLVLNASNKIEIMNANTFEEKGTIEGFSNPRYMIASNGYGYVSQWGDYSGNGPAVKVIDLSTRKITKTISTGDGSERMLLSGTNLLVANSGGYGSNNTITVINTTTNEVSKTISLEDNNPMGFVVDKDGSIWVLCFGSVIYSADYSSIESQTRSALIKLSPTTFEPLATIAISETSHPNQIAINPAGDIIYYGGGYSFHGIYAVGIDAAEVPSTPLIDESFYGLSVNPVNGEIAGLLAPSFSQVGQVIRYQANGTFIASVNAGIGPNTALYKN